MRPLAAGGTKGPGKVVSAAVAGPSKGLGEGVAFKVTRSVYRLPRAGWASYQRPNLSLTLSLLSWKMGVTVPPHKMGCRAQRNEASSKQCSQKTSCPL